MVRKKVTFVLRNKDCTLRHPYQTRAKTTIMSDIEQVQEQMKVDMEAMKEKMTTMMEVMMSMRKMMKVNDATTVVASTATVREPIHSPNFNQESSPVLGVVLQGGEATANVHEPHYVPVQSKTHFPSYGLHPNYTPPFAAYAPGENICSSTPVVIENKQMQPDHTHTHVPPVVNETYVAPQDYTLLNLGVYPRYTSEGHAFSGVPVLNAPGGPLHQPSSQPLHFVMREGPSAVAKKERFDHIEQRLRAIEGEEKYGFVDMSELCLVPNVVIPPKFKLPDFDKYKGTTCPKNHLKMYCRKMGSYAKDEKLLMHFFQESLTGAAVIWYANLKSSRVRSWKDLMDAFIKQYENNSYMAPDRMQLQDMCKGDNESFKAYAQRWRDLAAQVVPPMAEREMITMIMDTLPVFYYEKMVGYMPSSFADLLFAGERIEVGLRKGKFNRVASLNPSNRGPEMSDERNYEEEAHAITVVPTWPNFPQALYNPIYQYPPQQYHYLANISPAHYPPPYQPRTPNQPQRPPLNQPQNPPVTLPRPNTNQNTNQGRNFPERKPVQLTPLPMSYADLLPHLLNNVMVAINPAKIPQPPFPRGYNPNVACAYHGGVPGHSTEHCMSLKHKVQSLIDAGWLKFQEDNHNVQASPLANRGSAIEDQKT